MQAPKITVTGSINIDLVTSSPRFPQPGETLMGTSFERFMGGKGANQAVAAARLGASVSMVGAVGSDAFGREALENLKREGINIEGVQVLEDAPTGMANITVAEGDNHIIVVAGANSGITPAHIEACEKQIAAADAVLAQLEIPMACVITAAALARKHGKPFILNPAPAQKLPAELLDWVTLLTPNAHELAICLGLPENMPAEELIARAPCPVLMTRGSEGALYHDGQGKLRRQGGFNVMPVDTTGAGDTFNGAFAVFRAEGMETAVRKANAAAALSVTKAGAQSGMPDAAALATFLAAQTPP
ncbi:MULTISPECIES: ribokinase [Neisseria]|uniref:Ribokinase n=1 Tax=Neisseria musculi TaxID=1815583 RepID=A0A7H1MCV7_9NEIS|nr:MULTISPECIES: ribokinase [Neisseria]MBF0804350.1 ribokinase [Neisseria sp. 19428wB4_WF04]QNT59472.1 ribokinase [Neisseria musculi]TFU42882.1 ribokinase [Neisseria sp. WF04]